jgi:hypothetical protein
MPRISIPSAVRDLARELAEPVPMRRGSVSVRTVKCNKPGCRCQNDPQARHGPYCSLVRGSGGKTVSRWVPARQLEMLRAQVAAGQQFRRHLEAYWQACERWADAELQASGNGGEAAEKGGSRRASKPRSARRSKPSSGRAPTRA